MALLLTHPPTDAPCDRLPHGFVYPRTRAARKHPGTGDTIAGARVRGTRCQRMFRWYTNFSKSDMATLYGITLSRDPSSRMVAVTQT